MTRITVKQIDHLNAKVREAFGSFERVLDQQVKMEERKFVDDKKEQIAEKLGADKIKKALKEAEERYEKAQEDAKKFLKTFANKHKLQGTIRDYRYSDTKFKVSDIDEQVDLMSRIISFCGLADMMFVRDFLYYVCSYKTLLTVEQVKRIKEATEKTDEHKFSLHFLMTEWEQVVDVFLHPAIQQREVD